VCPCNQLGNLLHKQYRMDIHGAPQSAFAPPQLALLSPSVLPLTSRSEPGYCGAAPSQPPNTKPIQPTKGGQLLQLTGRPAPKPSKTNPRWKVEALEMLAKVPTCEDDQKLMEAVGLQTPETQVAALHLILGYKQTPDDLGRDCGGIDLTSSDTTSHDPEQLNSCLVHTAENYAASLDRIRFDRRIANFHQLVFGSMCHILFSHGIPINALMRKYLGKYDISDKHCGFYRRGALWVNSFVQELYSNNWNGRIELLFLLCKQVEIFLLLLLMYIRECTTCSIWTTSGAPRGCASAISKHLTFSGVSHQTTAGAILEQRTDWAASS
jgi:hypothetical protein